MALPTLNVQLPFPLSKAEVVKVHIRANDTVEDIIDSAIQLAKEVNAPITSEYGLFLCKKREWLYPSVKITQYRNILMNLNQNERIQLRPKTTISLTFTCLSYVVKFLCAPDQKLPIITNKLLGILRKTQDSLFFGGSDWSIFWDNGEISPDLTVQQALKFSDTFGLRKSTLRVKSATDLPVFGQNLHNALARTGPNATIPLFLQEIFKRIDASAGTEGLFRKSGQQSHIEEIANWIDTNSNPDEICKYIQQQPIHDLTSVLKLYLKNLANPLIPFAFYKTLEQYSKITDPNVKVIKIKQILDTFPLANYMIISRLLEILYHITLEETSKMNITNLAICISAIIIKNPDQNCDPISTQCVCQNICVDLLANYRFYFKGEPFYGKTCTGTAISDATYDGIEIKAGQEVSIIDSSPVDHTNMYQILINDTKLFVPQLYIYIESPNLFETATKTIIEDEPYSPDHYLFSTSEGIIGDHECYQKINDLTKLVQDKISEVHEIMIRASQDQDTDKVEFLREIQQLSESFVY